LKRRQCKCSLCPCVAGPRVVALATRLEPLCHHHTRASLLTWGLIPHPPPRKYRWSPSSRKEHGTLLCVLLSHSHSQSLDFRRLCHRQGAMRMLRSGEGEPAVRRAERALASQEGRLTVLAPQNCAGDNAIPTHLTDGETEAGRDRPSQGSRTTWG
jgi:hypothetical protein